MKSLPNVNNTRAVNGDSLRTASINDDIITEFNSDGSEDASITQTVISESYESVYSKLNKINISVDSCDNDHDSQLRSACSTPIIIGIPNSALTSTSE